MLNAPGRSLLLFQLVRLHAPSELFLAAKNIPCSLQGGMSGHMDMSSCGLDYAQLQRRNTSDCSVILLYHEKYGLRESLTAHL